jgi:hypothetical protein
MWHCSLDCGKLNGTYFPVLKASNNYLNKPSSAAIPLAIFSVNLEVGLAF